ncbi:MAG TPA: hypothetical protein V6C81_03090 [Planktothrix sp.]|jgi:molybdopterin-guanine dinucleotide biosynthesis protein A
MADPGAQISQISPKDLMAEALNKASSELDKAVKACIDQLQAYNDNLEKSLQNQLSKLIEQSKNFIESNVEDLGTHREELIDRLLEFERSEIDTMVSAARDVRQQVSARAQQAGDSISRLVEEQVAELRVLIENPESNFKDFSNINTRVLERNTSAGREKIGKDQIECEQLLTEKAQEFDQSVQLVVTDFKKSIEDALEQYNGEMENKITGGLNQLEGVVEQTVTALESGSKDGGKSIKQTVEQNASRLSDHLSQWKTDLDDLRSEFEQTIAQDARVAEKAHGTKLERKVGEVKDEINLISQDAASKITASHKLFFSSLRRLEKKYNDRLERLMSRFETALAEEAKLQTGSIQPSHELREQLHSRLEARGKDILKAFHRQVEILESEYARMSGGSHERIESIRTAAVEILDKQVRIMKNELDRIQRNFRTELADLNAELPKIEERGRAAAMAVQAYRSTMFSSPFD